MTDQVRFAAWKLVTGVTTDRKLLTEMLPNAVAHLPEGGRARATRLATETLRWASRADRVLGPYLKKKPHPDVHDMLRLAVWEMCADGQAAHGVVNAAVSILNASSETRRQSGLVNAILRRVAEAEIDWEALPLPQMPKWLRKPLVAAYGKDVVAAMEMAHAAGAPLDVTAKGNREELAEALGAQVLSTGSLRLAKSGQVTALPGFAEGDWWVQDAAAAIPVRCLGDVSGKQVLDLCAAPGGKTMQLASAGARVTALDSSEARLGRLRENLGRTRLDAEIVAADALDWVPEAPFEAILLDAPCSATGTIRRHPDLPYAKDLAAIEPLLELQAKLIDRALGMLAPGGQLIYCVCSLLPEEGEAQLEGALARHPGVTVASVDVPGIEPEWVTDTGALRLRPDFWIERGGMDGFFVAALQKPA